MSVIVANNPHISFPWASVDLGNAISTRTQDIDGAGTLNHLTTGGGAIYNDQMDDAHFTWRRVTGDFDIKCQVPEIPDTWNIRDVVAGLCCRETIDGTSQPVSAMIAVWYNQNTDAWGGQEKQYITTTGGLTSRLGDGVAANNWIRLVRTGNVFSWFYSADGTNWISAGTSQTLSNMPSTAYVGLMTNSQDPDYSEIDFDVDFTDIYLKRIGEIGGAGLLADSFQSASIGGQWNVLDDKDDSTFAQAAGAATITLASGSHNWDTPTFQSALLYQKIDPTQDFDIAIEVPNIFAWSTDGWEFLGLCAYTSVDEFVAIGYGYPDSAGGAVTHRFHDSGVDTQNWAGTALDGTQRSNSVWFRMKNVSGTFTLYHSLNGTSWTQKATQAMTGSFENIGIMLLNFQSTLAGISQSFSRIYDL